MSIERKLIGICFLDAPRLGRIAFASGSFPVIICRWARMSITFFRLFRYFGEGASVATAGQAAVGGNPGNNRPAVAGAGQTPPASRQSSRRKNHSGARFAFSRSGRFRSRAWDPRRRMVRGSMAQRSRPAGRGLGRGSACRSTGPSGGGFFRPPGAGQ